VKRLSALGWQLTAGALALGAARAARADDAAPTPEVRVIAPHRDVGETTVHRDDTRDIPGTFGDPTRFAETLPGVVPTASGLQAFFVRGAPPTATGYFIDGVPVPALYHVGFGPSVVHPGLIDHVDFYQGAPPAQYGRYVGGVLAATTTPPARSTHGEANLRVFDAGALGEAAFADGRGSALAAARYGYPGLILPLFAQNTSLEYWDYQARATWEVTDRDRIGAFVFGSYDRLTQRQTPSSAPAYDEQLVADQFHRVDLRWDRALGGSAALRLAATLGRDLVGSTTGNAKDDAVRLRAEYEARPSPALRVRAGADTQYDALRPDKAPPGTSPGLPPIVPSRDTVVIGAHADVAWRISPRVEVVPGLRADVYSTMRVPALPTGTSGSASPALDPRLAVRTRVTSRVTAVSSLGVSHQLPGVVAQYPDATPLIQPGVQEGLQSSVQASQGVIVSLPARFSLEATGFLHEYSGLPDATAPCTTSPVSTECVTPSVDGRAYGLELLLRRSFGERFTVWISYTLSRSERQARPYFSDVPSMTIPSEYDRTHVLSAIASYDFGNGWRAGGRVFAYSGRPYLATSLSVPVLPYNSERLPGFFRIDGRVEKSWRLGERGRIAVVLEGINLTLQKETVSAQCGTPPMTQSLVRGGPPHELAATPLDSCSFDMVGPITIPSIGVEASFR
jgi:hypothetical protein